MIALLFEKCHALMIDMGCAIAYLPLSVQPIALSIQLGSCLAYHNTYNNQPIFTSPSHPIYIPPNNNFTVQQLIIIHHSSNHHHLRYSSIGQSSSLHAPPIIPPSNTSPSS